ncbi:sulfite exporter TauE/SafE family protein [Croceicoccus mobilis]|uniref:Probable membrane transporter protein n=1 Tax=Croceicoccus mobilis TaxID=1703339 RepID=A0A916Z3C5_9SPHN|nr:sulfite exporter TauE/SafE family protein [Croceicoccus mobilis]GGD74298.1 UPF0721 transmembrane protein [Croceicoccus mobilis]
MNDTLTALIPYVALLLAGCGAGFAGGLFGIGGGFVVVPALTLILPLMGTEPDQVMHVAVGTSLATIIFTSIRSVRSHAARGSVDFGFLRGWGIWIAAGSVLGAFIADYFTSRGLAVTFGIGVLLFAVYFLAPINTEKQLLKGEPGTAARLSIATSLGTFSSLLGIGGGTITTLLMTSYGTSIHRAIGTASGVGAFIAVPATIGFIYTGWGEAGMPALSIGHVSLPATAAIVVTAMIFAPLGVAAAHKLSPALLKRIFGLYLIFVGVTMLT